MRFLKYCQLVDCPFEVILLDGGLPNDLENFSKDFSFVRYERCAYDKTIKHFVSKMVYGHSLVKTPFVMDMDNDDFFDVSGLLCACDFLIKNKSFVSFCGDVKSFVSRENGIVLDKSIYTNPSILGKTGKERMENCFKNFHSFWHNVTWTHHSEMVFKLIEGTGIDDFKFLSLLQTCLLAAMGEMERNNKISYYFHQTNSPEVEGVDRASNLAFISRKNWLSNLATANFCVSVVDDSCEFEKNYVDFLIENIGLDAAQAKELFDRVDTKGEKVSHKVAKTLQREVYFVNPVAPVRKISEEFALPVSNEGSDEYFYTIQFIFNKMYEEHFLAITPTCVKKEKIKAYNVGCVDGSDVKINYQENLKRGKGTTFNDNCWLNARYGIEIGENTLFGPNVLVHSANHVLTPFNIEGNANDENSWCKGDRNKRIVGEKVTIGNDVWVGANVIILAGATIPDKCVIGAGTIITKKKSLRLKPGDIVVNDVDIKILGNRKNIKWDKENI